MVHAEKPLLANLFPLFQLKDFQKNRLSLEITCNEFQRDLIEKDLAFITRALTKVNNAEVKPLIAYDIQIVKPGQKIEDSKTQKKENLKEIEKLKAEDPLFKKFIDEFGLELE